MPSIQSCAVGGECFKIELGDIVSQRSAT